MTMELQRCTFDRGGGFVEFIILQLLRDLVKFSGFNDNITGSSRRRAHVENDHLRSSNIEATVYS
jgi:hypothetical protein